MKIESNFNYECGCFADAEDAGGAWAFLTALGVEIEAECDDNGSEYRIFIPAMQGYFWPLDDQPASWVAAVKGVTAVV